MKNYLGQIRIYTLLDLVLLLIAVQANKYQFVGLVYIISNL